MLQNIPSLFQIRIRYYFFLSSDLSFNSDYVLVINFSALYLNLTLGIFKEILFAPDQE